MAPRVRDPGTYDRLRAAREVAARQPAAGVRLLRELIADRTFESDENVTRPRRHAVDALVSLGERQLAEETLRATFDDDSVPPAIRSECAEELARLGAGTAALLAFARENVRHGAWVAHALTRHGHRAEAVEFLQAAAADPHCLERVRAAVWLTQPPFAVHADPKAER